MDELRLAVVPAPGSSEFAVEIYVNDVEMTAVGAGLGMDPYDVLVPGGRLLGDQVQVPVARCECGTYGCGSTDVVIAREGPVVRWRWEFEAPLNRDCRFETSAYDAEVRRAEEDTSWETPDRSAGRAVWAALVGQPLRHGLDLRSVGNDWRDPSLFRASLNWTNTHQIFVTVPWGDHTPETLADELVRTLTDAPLDEWRAVWHAVSRDGGAPPFAPKQWAQFDFALHW